MVIFHCRVNLPDGVFFLSSLAGGTVPAADACVQDPGGVCCSKFSEPGKEMRGRLPRFQQPEVPRNTLGASYMRLCGWNSHKIPISSLLVIWSYFQIFLLRGLQRVRVFFCFASLGKTVPPSRPVIWQVLVNSKVLCQGLRKAIEDVSPMETMKNSSSAIQGVLWMGCMGWRLKQATSWSFKSTLYDDQVHCSVFIGDFK